MKLYKSRCKAEQSVILFVLLIYARGLLLVLCYNFICIPCESHWEPGLCYGIRNTHGAWEVIPST